MAAGTPAWQLAHTNAPSTLTSHRQRESHPALHPCPLTQVTGLENYNETDTSSHAHKPLPNRPAQKTPTNHQIPQPTATCLVKTCKPAKTLLGHTPHPTCMNKHWTQHTQQQAQGHTVSALEHTDHRQNQTHPGKGHTNNMSPSERQLHTLNKLTNDPPTASAQGRPEGQHMWVQSQGTDTHSPVCAHTQARKCAYPLQHVTPATGCAHQ